TTSVSGRGISARRSTFSTSRRKPHSPSTYCSGSRRARRSTNVPSRSSSSAVRRLDPSTRNSDRDSPSTWPTSSPAAAWAVPTPFAASTAVRRRRTGRSKSGGAARSDRCCLEGTPSLLGLQRLGVLVEVAREYLLETVGRQLDAVIGEPVLGKVVGADLLG